MTRLVRNWVAIKAKDISVASHKYIWDTDLDKDVSMAETYKEAKSRIPYKVGEVIYVDGFGLALIHSVHVERNFHGDWVEFYHIQHETKDGLFSKVWRRAYPGHVQRGYKKAGLAPDVKY